MKRSSLKKMLAGLLASTLTLTSISLVSVSAAVPATEEPIYLFEADFEGEAVGEAPRTISGTGVLATTANAIVKQGEAESDKTDKYISISGSSARVRGWLNNPVSSGKLNIEFDMNGGQKGSTAFGFLGNDSNASTGKWVMGLQNAKTAKHILTWQTTGGNPPAGTTDKYTNLNGDVMEYKPETWQHYKVQADFDNSTVTIWVDGEKSKTIENYEYFGNDKAIGGIIFYGNKAQTATEKEEGIPADETFIDNIKVYKSPEIANYLVNENFESYAVTAEGGNTENTGPGWIYNKPDGLFPYIAQSDGSKTIQEENISKYMKFSTHAIGKGEAIRIMFPNSQSFNTGKLYIELDGYVDAGGLCVGVNDTSADDSYLKQYIMGVGNMNSSPSRALKTYPASTASITPPGGGTVVKDAATTLAAKTKVWQHYKLTLDFEASTVTFDLDGSVVTMSGYDYIGTDKDAINGIAIRANIPSGTVTEKNGVTFSYDTMFDNLKVYTTTPEYNILENKAGSDKILVNLNQAVNMTVDDITVLDVNGAETGVAVSEITYDDAAAGTNKAARLTLDQALPAGNYILKFADTVTYVSNSKAMYNKLLNFEVGGFSVTPVINVPADLSAGTTVTADLKLVDKDLVDGNKAVYVLAAYDDKGMLTDVAVDDSKLTAPYNNGEAQVETETENFLSLTLTKPAAKVKAFAWNEQNVPYVAADIYPAE